MLTCVVHLAKIPQTHTSHLPARAIPIGSPKRKPLINAALPKSSGKKPGGQHGHTGKILQVVEHPDEIHIHSASQCGNCGLALQGEGQVVACRQVFDFPATRLWVR